MKILVVSPHPDDETLGCGGTLIKMKKKGHQIYWLNITDMGIEDGWDERHVKHRKKQIIAVKQLYHFDGFFNLAFSPTKLSGMDENELIREIKFVFDEVKPEWIIIPGRYDAHSDHHIVHDCCMACAKTFRALYIKRITTMEIVSETEFGFQQEKFVPNLFIDISNEMEEKLNAIKLYDTEIEASPFPRSLENIMALATLRGSTSSCKYAEAFYIVKQIE